MFNFFEKQIIVNDDTQVVLREDDGTAYADNDVSSSAGGFMLEGFLSNVITAADVQALAGGAKMIKTAFSAGVANIKAYTMNTTALPAGSAFRITEESLDLTPTEYQNRYTEKRYQSSTVTASAVATIAQLVATINADPKASVIAYAGFDNTGNSPSQDDSGKIVLVAKNPGTIINLYSGDAGNLDITAVALATTVVHTAIDTTVVTINGALPVNTYDYLKNVNWSKNVDIDRNLNWHPLPGVNYNGYYFEVNGAVQPSVGGEPMVSQVQNDVRYGVKLYVSTAATELNARLTDLLTDLVT